MKLCCAASSNFILILFLCETLNCTAVTDLKVKPEPDCIIEVIFHHVE